MPILRGHPCPPLNDYKSLWQFNLLTNDQFEYHELIIFPNHKTSLSTAKCSLHAVTGENNEDMSFKLVIEVQDKLFQALAVLPGLEIRMSSKSCSPFTSSHSKMDYNIPLMEYSTPSRNCWGLIVPDLRGW